MPGGVGDLLDLADQVQPRGGGTLLRRNCISSLMPLAAQIIWLFLLALPIATISWTVTHEEIFREPREYCVRQSEQAPSVLRRKFFFLFTCEFCFSNYVTILFLAITRYKLLLPDWRGYLIAALALVWVANQYMSLYGHLRLDIKKERVEIKKVEKQVEQKSKPGGQEIRPAA